MRNKLNYEEGNTVRAVKVVLINHLRNGMQSIPKISVWRRERNQVKLNIGSGVVMLQILCLSEGNTFMLLWRWRQTVLCLGHTNH